ncbi:MAG TPA: DNA-binding protein, partial [Opitutaceae bacterium]|nr:DNA-binding protein [Opitutaceae bacterium]
MNPEQFWTSQDGQILLVKNKDERTVTLTVAFWPRNPTEFEFMKARIGDLKTTERSSLARIGIEMQIQRGLEIDGNRLVLSVDAFAFDMSFPNSGYWKKLLRPGIPVGRLFYAPARAKLSSDEIWTAIRENRLKLPNTISIDSQGSVFLTPHQVSYTLNPRLQRINFELIVSGAAGRNFLDKVQIRHDASPLTILPRSGILTSCSMYLKEHYVVLNQGAGNFGIHSSAILLDPVKTFGTNVMLEIYNTGDHPVVNPMVSVEIFRAPEATDPEYNSLLRRRQRLLGTAAELYTNLDERPPTDPGEARPMTGISVKGQSAKMENRSVCLKAGTAEDVKRLYAENGGACGH